jgi:hypothetical protein
MNKDTEAQVHWDLPSDELPAKNRLIFENLTLA